MDACFGNILEFMVTKVYSPRKPSELGGLLKVQQKEQEVFFPLQGKHS